jgi:gliding motility-associated-like protein
MKRILAFCILFASILSVNAALYKVTTTNFTGPGSISEAITNANSGTDTVLCDLKGTINFSSTLTLTNNVRIIGPSSENLVLQSSGLTIFNINVSASNVSISGLTFTTSGISGGSAIVSGASELKIYDCIFTNCNSSGIGGAITANTGGLTVHSCSFVNVVAASNGGSIFLTTNSGLPSNIVNCTFGRTLGFSTENSQNGGAIYINVSSGTVNIVNNTFARLSVTTQGGAIYSNVANYNLRNNIFYQNAPNSQYRDLGGTMPSVRGFNCFQQAPTAYVPGTNDINGGSWASWISSNSSLQLQKFGRGQYGLNINEFAPNIDNADQSAIVNFFDNFGIERKDVRSAPREVQGIYYGNHQLDRGSLEYSPFRVTNNNATGSGSLASIVDSVNNSIRPGPLYVWFEIAGSGPHTILAASQYVTNRAFTYLDGFSQLGSKEGSVSFGPEYSIDIVDNASLVSCFYTFGDNTEIRGFKIQDFDIPIILFSNSVGVYGNYIINGNYGITSGGSTSSCLIGSNKGKDRNYIVSCNAKAMEIGGSYHWIKGNYIGVQPNGVANGNSEGIDINGALDCLIGGGSSAEGNLICGSTLYGIRLVGSSSCQVKNNILGINSTNTSTAGFENSRGIEVESSNNNFIGGSIYPGGGNVIASATGDGVYISNSGSNYFHGNIIGLRPDGLTAGSIANNGIRITGTTNNNYIGDYMNVVYRNIISNCQQSGVFSDATSGNSNYISLNYIGTDKNGENNMGNGQDGIHLFGLLDGLYTQASVEYNLVANHSNATFGRGVFVENCSANLYENTLGKYLNGTAASNRIGVHLKGDDVYGNVTQNRIFNSLQQGILVDDVTADFGLGIDFNNIQYNGAQGVFVTNGSKKVDFYNDSVKNNGNGGIIVANGCDSVIMEYCYMYDNGTGLDFDLGTAGPGGYTLNEAVSFPFISSANYCTGQLTIDGSFSDANFPSTEFSCVFYLIPAGSAHSSNHGGTHEVIGSDYIFTDATGFTTFNFNYSNTFNIGDMVTMAITKIESEGRHLTSELAANVAISSNLSVTVTPSNPLCSSDLGSATATVVGSSNDPEWHLVSALGNPFSFGTTVSNLLPDNYACIIVNGGCTDTAFFTITAPTILNPGIASTLTNVNCLGGTDGSLQLTTAASGGTLPYQYSIDNVIFQASDLFSGLSAGTYAIFVRDANNCIDTTASITVSEPATALTVTTSTTNLTCNGSDDGTITTTISGGSPGYSFTWTGPNSFVATTQNITSLEPGFYVLTATDINGCQVIENAAEIIEPATNNVNFTISNATPCVGEGVTFTNTSDPGATAFFWDFGNGNLANNTLENSGSFYTTAGAYTVKYIVNWGICSDSLSQIINVNPVPVLTNANSTNICSGDNVNFTFTADIASTFTWYGIDNTNVSGESLTNQTTNINNDVLINNSGTPQIVEYIVIPATAQCTSSGQSFYAWVYPLPNVVAPNDTTICANESLTLSGSGAASYSWDNGITDGVAFNPSNTTTYTVTGTDGNGCQNTDATTLVVNTLPTISAPSDYAICNGESTTLNATGGLTYSWDNGVSDGISFTPIGTQSYTVIGQDANGCQNSDAVTVTVNALPTITAPNFYSICQGESTTLTATGGVSYTWDNGVSNGVAFTPSVFATYTVVGVDGNGCQNNDTVSIAINNLPTVIAPTDYTICSGASTTLNGLGALTYVWNNGVTDGIAFNPTSTALYTVTGTDVNGCENTDQVTITVSSPISLTFNVTNVSCNGLSDGEIEYTASGGTAPYTIGINGNNPFTMSSNPTILGGLSGGYTFNGILTDANGCQATNSTNITEPNAISYSIITLSDTCSAGVGTLSYTSVTGGTTPYTYGDLSGMNSSSSVFVGNGGSYNTFVEDANGCVSNQSTTIGNVTAPVNGGTFGPYETCDDEPIEIVAFGGTSYQWSGGSTAIPSVANPTVNPTLTTLYYVTIAFGTCSMVDSVLVSISSSCDSLDNNTVINTNAFSPNGDGINDVVTFDIPNLLQDKDNKVYFINRWGDVIREYDNYNNIDVAWDGKNKNGIDLPEGTYFYIIEIPSLDYKASGWIQLIRNNSNN